MSASHRKSVAKHHWPSKKEHFMNIRQKMMFVKLQLEFTHEIPGWVRLSTSSFRALFAPFGRWLEMGCRVDLDVARPCCAGVTRQEANGSLWGRCKRSIDVIICQLITNIWVGWARSDRVGKTVGKKWVAPWLICVRHVDAWHVSSEYS